MEKITVRNRLQGSYFGSPMTNKWINRPTSLKREEYRVKTGRLNNDASN